MSQSDLYIKQIPVGPMQNFAYLIGSQSTKECYAVDPAWEVDSLVKVATTDGMKIIGALVTHYHPDHCGGTYWGRQIPGVAELNGLLNVPVVANTHEVEGIIKVTGLSQSDFKICQGGDTLTVGGVDIKLIHTPGHTPGSQCFLCESRLISGDTLFISGCGRVDLPGGDGDKLFESLKTLGNLPADTEVLPGHHYDPQNSATMAEVKKVNPYLQQATREAFKDLRGPSKS